MVIKCVILFLELKRKCRMLMVEFKNEATKPLHGRSYTYDLHYHLVWVTKYRDKAFTPEIQQALKTKLVEIANDNGYTIQAIEVLENHVHILISAKPFVSVTVMIKKLKGISGLWLIKTFPMQMNKHFRHHHIWSPSYYVGSVGNTNEAIIKQYIVTQKERPYK